jgi:hypothetical protein
MTTVSLLELSWEDRTVYLQLSQAEELHKLGLHFTLLHFLSKNNGTVKKVDGWPNEWIMPRTVTDLEFKSLVVALTDTRKSQDGRIAHEYINNCLGLGHTLPS